MPEFYTPQEIADKLRISRETAYTMIRTGVIRAHKVGIVRGKGHWRISGDALREYIDSLEELQPE